MFAKWICLNCKMHLTELKHVIIYVISYIYVFVEVFKCICLSYQMYLSRLPNVFVSRLSQQITQKDAISYFSYSSYSYFYWTELIWFLCQAKRAKSHIYPIPIISLCGTVSSFSLSVSFEWQEKLQETKSPPSWDACKHRFATKYKSSPTCANAQRLRVHCVDISRY